MSNMMAVFISIIGKYPNRILSYLFLENMNKYHLLEKRGGF